MRMVSRLACDIGLASATLIEILLFPADRYGRLPSFAK
jgi:hypothetical protein